MQQKDLRFCLPLLLLLSGCSSSTPTTDTSPMSEDEITQMYSDPDSFGPHARAVRPCVQRARVR